MDPDHAVAVQDQADVLPIGPGWCRRQLRFEEGRVPLRLDEIRKARASIRFVSLEPLIGSFQRAT